MCGLISQLRVPHRRDYHVDLLDRLHQALIIVQITQDKIEAQILEVLEKFGLFRVREGSFSDQKVGGVAGLGAGLDNDL